MVFERMVDYLVGLGVREQLGDFSVFQCLSPNLEECVGGKGALYRLFLDNVDKEQLEADEDENEDGKSVSSPFNYTL